MQAHRFVRDTALAGGVATPLSTFSTADELRRLLAASACSVLLLERRVLKKDFALTLSALEPTIGASPPGGLPVPGLPFLRHLAMVGYLGITLDETLDEEGFFLTGDGGHIDLRGRLFWEGRLNDIIKTAGHPTGT